ncbi:MAG: Ni/Fe hydrogenase subunit alpha [Euryarchaeota archaeon]|nr:Ni/Fe hydrogenase subunit alpha [Euryarchaeota archaeon]
MQKTIVIQPVTRIEGHAKVTIQLNDQGNVEDTKMSITTLRGFEEFCKGRPVEEMPRITTSICGVCPVSHHLAAAKAGDAVLGVDIPPAGKKLRELLNAFAYTEEHMLHFFFLAAPDFLIGPGAPVKDRNIFGVIRAMPDVATKVAVTRTKANKAIEMIGGRAIHPVAATPGGFSKPLTEAEIEKLKKIGKDILDLAVFTMKYTKENVFPKYLDTIKTLGVIKTGFMGTVDKDGAMDLYDGKIRLMKADGTHKEFAAGDYDKHIKEHVEPWSYMKFPYNPDMGAFSLEPNSPGGMYRTNTLARINVAEKIRTPLAQAELVEFRNAFGRPAQQTLLYHYARLIEMLYNAEYLNQLLDDPDIKSHDIRKAVTPRAARGVGSVEAPRGTLLHDYETDEKGLIKYVNLIVGTTHNNGPMNMSVKQAARSLIKDGKYDETILNMIEMTIRPYDPCLSCATHNLDGSLAVQVDIRGPKGELLDSYKN